MSVGVGVIGVGTVGGGVVRILLTNHGVIDSKAGCSIRLAHVCDKDDNAISALGIEAVRTGTDASALINDPDVSIVCELIGGVKPAKKLILDALKAGKSVVTANKMLLALHGQELAKAAVDCGVELRYEAAVAGGIPIIKSLREGLAANRIQSVYGILNGTCNYILSRMTYDNLEFDEALRQATAWGFAETPPDLDIQGHDTAHKCQIVASLSFSTEVELGRIYVEGITKVTLADVAYAREMGYLIKLLAIVRDADGAIEARVHPTLVPEDHLLASVRNEFNALFVQSDIAGNTMYYGKGAGRMPTASAVVADIIDIVRRGTAPAPAPFLYQQLRPVLDIGRLRSRYYLRLTTLDRPGVLGKVCTILGNHGVSIASCIQKEEHEESVVHVVMMTHEAVESSVRAALREIDGLDFIREATHVIRVL
ncbi:MAG: homoserine dehydrogenase [Candidatus Hydrogenedentes bacterium]|nr:homoserine dehydrogenase [Candidatus Hydrogenedentota bacterium]